MKKRTFIIITISIHFILLLLFVLLDYLNIFGILTSNLNIDFISTYLNNLTTITLFVLSYVLINKKINDNETEKKHNKETALFIILNKTYEKCYETLEFFRDSDILKEYIVPKVEFNNISDPFLKFQMDRIFDFDSKILEFASDGVAKKKIFEQYLDIKSDFQEFMNLKVALYDVSSSNYEKNDMIYFTKNNLDSLEKKLIMNLKNALKKTKNELGDK